MNLDNVQPINQNAVRIVNGIPKLIGGRCSTCGRYFFPHREFCPSCFNEGKVEEMELDTHGSLQSFTVIRRAPGRAVPYAVGYILTPENLLLFAPLIDCEMDSLYQKMKLKIVFYERQDRDGRRVISYGYTAVDTAKGER